MEMFSIVAQYIVIGYAVLVFVKMCLVFPTNGIAAGVLSRKSGASFWYFYSSICLTMPIVLTVRVPFLLYAEGLRFFVVYSKYEVIKDLLTSINTHRAKVKT